MYSIGCNSQTLAKDNYYKIVKKLAAALTIIDINTFFQIRINRRNQFFILGNNEEITNYLFNENRDVGTLLSQLSKTAICGKISVAAWTNYNDDTFLKKSTS